MQTSERVPREAAAPPRVLNIFPEPGSDGAVKPALFAWFALSRCLHTCLSHSHPNAEVSDLEVVVHSGTRIYISVNDPIVFCSSSIFSYLLLISFAV
jgi:hypothetical protein